MFWNKKQTEVKAYAPKSPGFFSTDVMPVSNMHLAQAVKSAFDNSFQRKVSDAKIFDPLSGIATDAKDTIGLDSSLKSSSGYAPLGYTTVPFSQVSWYGAQGFIGYQMCAMMAQHWLIDKACTMPARDAIRNGFEITVNDGTTVDPKVIQEIKEADQRHGLSENLLQFVRMGKVFGIRILVFKVASDDKQYYEKPFNIDAVKPGAYEGIVQIDPYWITPELDMDAASNPFSKHFYEPTWWRVNGMRIHRSHCAVFRTNEVADVLKPTYFYGGVSVPQKIYERVYAAERTANEAPQLAMTKRTAVIKMDLTKALGQQKKLEDNLNQWVQLMNNFGIKVIGDGEEYQQFDTSLADFDAVTMTQYQIVAGAADVPVTKLMGTTPKGFNSTGEHEESSYHETLESIQKNDLTAVVDRHHELVIASEIAPINKIAPFKTEIVWESLDAPTAKERAEINEINARAGTSLVNSGAISGEEERERIIKDPESGYSGLTGDAPEQEEEESFEDGSTENEEDIN